LESKFMKRISVSLAAFLVAAAQPAFAQTPSPSPSPSATPTASPTPAKDSKETPKWDVANPPGPKSTAKLDVTEGTWMTVDVSPDGTELVFDLLGDIYSLPIAGGEAKNLTSGGAWDMQPRFSPDGKQIAFTSDRAGGDNIWIMNRDGSKPKQVTKESFRLLNSPTWSPDGQYIAARKHFTATRSLGAGEIWLYHVSGGDGLQVTKKANDQKDVGEPVFSKDGKTIYYSMDATPGNFFEYNKNPYDGIYAIRAVNIETGENEGVTGGPGGAVRPVISRDGKKLAFARRIRDKEVLMLRDLASGREWPIYDGLERDMQEAWAIHGLYPTYAWTPDDVAIVLWAGGKLRKLDVASKAVSDIPFRVKDTRTVSDAVRFPIEVAPNSVSVKMLRFVEVAPTGDKVLFQALGRVWIRDLPEGKPRRLTTQTDHWEVYPSFSRDGKSVVYTTWDDDKLATIRIAPTSGGEGRVVVADAGHYLEPAFSPDGATIVYRKGGGGFLRSELYSSNQGIYRVPAAGGASTLVTKRGVRPHFGKANDRVFFQKFEGDTRSLSSVGLDGRDERAHFASKEATEFKVSPDGQWVAFREGFKGFIAQFAMSGQKIDLGPKTTAFPVAQISKEAGEYLHWSGDSSKLYWALGPELFERKVTDSFKFLANGETVAELPTSGKNVGFSVDADTPKSKIAFVGGRVLTMTSDREIADGVVVVENNRITAVGPRGSTTVPADAKVIDVAGKTVMPGIVDVHWHGGFGTDEIVPQRNWVMYASLGFGVTTIHDPSNDTSTVFAAAEMSRAGLITAPRIFSTGTILYGAAGDFRAEINSLDDARFHLKKLKADGAFSVKSYNQPRREQRQQIVAAARELGMMVVPEGGSLYQHNMTMVADGNTGVEHSVPVAKLYEDALQLWSQTKSGYTPTLVVGYGGLSGEMYWYERTRVWQNKRLLTFVPQENVDARSRRPIMSAGDDDFNHVNIAKSANDLYKRGVSVNLGAHGQREGLGAHWEMWMLAQGGMKPLDVLKVATINGARYLGLDKDIGSLEVGKLADVIVIDGNPLTDIRVSEKVSHTMVNGRLYDASNGDQLLPTPTKRAKFFWEN
jgi:imidazolonepropionase-like amidohydrolase/Tol biopolymer transport system component